MTSEKQILANQQNSQLSTGPKTAEGKITISTNAIKHGVFTKDLLISTRLGKENEAEYLEMLNNLSSCLSPQNQMESLLVEKIAIDFWRLRRVIRFEAGSIGKYLEIIYNEFYSYGRKNNEELDTEIQAIREYVDWITAYLDHLKKEEVSFESPTWEGEELESDIADDFRLIIKTLDTISYEMKKELLYGESDFSQLKTILKESGYARKREISEKLIEIYVEEIERSKQELDTLEKKRLMNFETDNLNSMLGMIPEETSSDKILKYERSIQKSIFQNLFLLKKLQTPC